MSGLWYDPIDWLSGSGFARKVVGRVTGGFIESASRRFVGSLGVLGGETAERTVTSTAQVQLNRTAGNAFRDEVATALRAAGRYVRTEVFKRTPFGKRFIDVEVSVLGDEFRMVLGGIEAKVGSSRYGPWQRLKDLWLKNNRSYPVNVIRKQ